MKAVTVCQRCILDSRIPGVFFDASQICNFCQSDKGIAREVDRVRMRKLWDTVKRSNQTVIVAFSGGNDSAAGLTYLLRQFDLRCVCIMVDNGFIPDTVKERAIRFCNNMGVELVIKTFSLIDALARRLCDPCSICMPHIFGLLAESALYYNTEAITTGHLYGPAFQPYKMGATQLTKIAPLYIETVDELHRKELLEEAGWQSSLRFGPSSNCLLIGYLELLYQKKWGYSPQVAELSHEIRAGTLSRASALEKLGTYQTFLPEYEKVIDLLQQREKMQI